MLSENEQFVSDELYSHIMRYVFDSAEVHVALCSLNSIVTAIVAFEFDLKEIRPLGMPINLLYASIQTSYCRHCHSKMMFTSYNPLHIFFLSSFYLREFQSLDSV